MRKPRCEKFTEAIKIPSCLLALLSFVAVPLLACSLLPLHVSPLATLHRAEFASLSGVVSLPSPRKNQFSDMHISDIRWTRIDVSVILYRWDGCRRDSLYERKRSARGCAGLTSIASNIGRRCCNTVLSLSSLQVGSSSSQYPPRLTVAWSGAEKRASYVSVPSGIAETDTRIRIEQPPSNRSPKNPISLAESRERKNIKLVSQLILFNLNSVQNLHSYRFRNIKLVARRTFLRH